MLSGAIPLTTFRGVTAQAAAAGESSDKLHQFIARLPAALVADAVSSLLRRRVVSMTERLEITAAVIALLRNTPRVTMVHNPRTLRNPLHWAAYGGYVSVAEFMIGAGSDINAADGHGFTPLDYATAGQRHMDDDTTQPMMTEWFERRRGYRGGRAFSGDEQ